MKKLSMRLSILAAVAALICLPHNALAATPEGTWLSHDGGTKVRISNCGGKLCGTVVWLKEPTDADGKPKTDKLNPDPAKRSKPMLGLPVVQGMAPNGPDKWSGQIYNADDGKVYQASVTPEGASALKVQGCVLGLLCKTHTWTRAN